MIPEREASSILESFRGKRILVAGDLVLDHYLEGAVSRISPEAPVPVVSLGRDSERWIPGGAANVALNVLSLGGVPVLAGAVGGIPRGKSSFTSWTTPVLIPPPWWWTTKGPPR